MSSSHDDTILIWNFLEQNPNQDTAILNMGAWPALAHSSHPLNNHNGAMFGLGEGPSNGINGRMRRRAQNENPRIAPPPPSVQQQQQQADAHMEVDEPAVQNDSGSDNNTDDEVNA